MWRILSFSRATTASAVERRDRAGKNTFMTVSNNFFPTDVVILPGQKADFCKASKKEMLLETSKLKRQWNCVNHIGHWSAFNSILGERGALFCYQQSREKELIVVCVGIGSQMILRLEETYWTEQVLQAWTWKARRSLPEQRGARRSHISARERGVEEGWNWTGAKAGQSFWQTKLAMSEPTNFGGQDGSNGIGPSWNGLFQVKFWVHSPI